MSTGKRITPASFIAQQGAKKTKIAYDDQNLGAPRNLTLAEVDEHVGGKFCEEQNEACSHGKSEPFVRKDEGDTLMGWGMHRNKTYREVYYTQKDYYDNFVKTLRDPNARQKRFMDWVERETGEEKPQVTPLPTTKKVENVGDTVFEFGKHAGRTFLDVFYKFDDYEKWARARPDGASGQLKEYLDWVDDFIVSLRSPCRNGKASKQLIREIVDV